MGKYITTPEGYSRILASYHPTSYHATVYYKESRSALAKTREQLAAAKARITALKYEPVTKPAFGQGPLSITQPRYRPGYTPGLTRPQISRIPTGEFTTQETTGLPVTKKLSTVNLILLVIGGLLLFKMIRKK